MMRHSASIPSVCVVLLGLAAAALARPGQDKDETKAPAPAVFDPKGSDEAAMALVRKLWDSMGGKAAWDAVTVLTFDAVIEREGKPVRQTSWVWERATDRFRMQMTGKLGTVVALYDRKEKRGVATVDGKPIPEAEHDAVLKQAIAYFEFDTNFLVLPWKLMDPFAHLKSLEPVEQAGRKLPRVEFWLDEGHEQEPGWRYVLTLDPVGHRLQEWSYTVKLAPEGAEPPKFAWIDWADVGDLQFCTDKEGLNVPYRVSAVNVATPDRTPEGAFEGL